VDLMGGHRHPAKKPRMSVESRQAILDAERILIDEDRPKTESPLKGDGRSSWVCDWRANA
jgi:hypothetical protein